jgi:hypothetical protein
MAVVFGNSRGGGGGGWPDDDFDDEGGRELGQLRLRGGDDMDSQRLNANNMSQVKLCAKRNDIRLNFFEVRYGNGETHVVHNGGMIRRGQCTNWKNLNGGRRNIDAVRARGGVIGGEALLVIRGR